MKMGFTGTRHGMTQAQKDKFIELMFIGAGYEFHHGCCAGADTQAHELLRAQSVKTYIVGHPPTNDILTTWTIEDCDELRDKKPYIQRNRVIVSEADSMIAAPAEMTEQIKGGTWSTVRFANKHGVPCYIIFPDGSVKNSKEFMKSSEKT